MTALHLVQLGFQRQRRCRHLLFRLNLKLRHFRSQGHQLCSGQTTTPRQQHKIGHSPATKAPTKRRQTHTSGKGREGKGREGTHAQTRNTARHSPGPAPTPAPTPAPAPAPAPATTYTLENKHSSDLWWCKTHTRGCRQHAHTAQRHGGADHTARICRCTTKHRARHRQRASGEQVSLLVQRRRPTRLRRAGAET